ncbi:MAG: ABC transporter ATP-binding protein [Humibacillus sp.]
MATTDRAPTIRTVDLTKRFGARRGIEDVTLEVGEGEVFGFLGPNGAGKSTMIRVLMGLYRPHSGSARIWGRDAFDAGAELRRDIGYLPGELALFPRLTGRETLERLGSVRGLTSTSLRDELIERLGAEVDQPVRTLSKGNRQKLGLVQAFMHRPRLLVLDEPTSGLDPLLQEEFSRLVHDVAADGVTVFLSSHDLDEVQRLVSSLAIIRGGRIVAVDTVEKLLRNAPRVVELHFAGPPPTSFEDLPGVTVTERGRRHVTLAVTAQMCAVLRAAVDGEVTDITARPVSLEELFLRFYDLESGESAHAH